MEDPSQWYEGRQNMSPWWDALRTAQPRFCGLPVKMYGLSVGMMKHWKNPVRNLSPLYTVKVKKDRERLRTCSTLKGNKEIWQTKATCDLRLVLNQKRKRNVVEKVGKFWVKSVAAMPFPDLEDLWLLSKRVTLFGKAHTDVFRGMRDPIYNLSSNSSEKE